MLSFGRINAPESLLRMIYRFIKGPFFVGVYLDEVMIFPMSLGKHFELNSAVLKRISGCKLRIRLSKCIFAHAKIHPFEKIAGVSAIHVGPVKIAVIQETPTPCIKTDLRSVFGLESCHKRLMKGFAGTPAVLYLWLAGKET